MCSCPCHQGDAARAGHSWPNCRCVGNAEPTRVTYRAELIGEPAALSGYRDGDAHTNGSQS